MKKVIVLFDNVVTRFWMIFLATILGVSFICKAMYNMDDFPFFEYTKGLDIVLVVTLLIGYIMLFKFHSFIENKVPYTILLFLFGVVAIGFVMMVPIEPISDPKEVVNGALMFARGDIDGILSSEYMQYIMKNMKVAIFYALFILPFPKTVIALRLVNVFFYLLVVIFTGKICKNLYKDYEKTAFIIVASFFPLIFYCNQVYFDMPVLCAGTIALYFYTKEKSVTNITLAAIFVGIASYLRVLGFLFAIAIMIDYVFHSIHNRKENGCRVNYKSFLTIVIIILAIVFFFVGVDFIINYMFSAEGSSKESIWALFWMGINEPEFGMMHNEYLAEAQNKSFFDFIDLLCSRSFTQNLSLFGKKILWTWTQGTYQCQRYGFGYDVEDITGKFIYNTPLVSRFANTSLLLPATLISICRAQYMALMILMLIGVFSIIVRKQFDLYRVFVYLFFGTFWILVFYEMKSRYVFHLVSSMCILAVFGLINLQTHKYSIESIYTSNKVQIKRYAKIVFLLLMIISIITLTIHRRTIIAQDVKENQRQNANVYCQQSGLNIVERNISISNISREYEFLYIADTHAVASSMDELPAWNTTTDSRREMFKNALGVESRAQFETWINVCNALQVDALLLGGDIIDYGDDENIDWLKKQLSVLQAPYLYTLGNHDSFDVINDKQNHDNAKLKELFLDNDLDCAYMEYDEFIVCQVDDSLNRVSQTALDKFKEVYSMGKPIILVTHVPLYTENNIDFKMTTEELRGEDRLIGYGLDYEMDEYTKEFFDLVTASDSPVKLVLDGHVHFNHEDMLNETMPQYTVGSATDGQAYLIKITQ